MIDALRNDAPGDGPSAGRIKESVLRMYLAHPFPRLDAAQRRADLPSELCRYRFLGMSEAMHGARFLDVGCGTGDRSMLVAKHLGVKEFVGIDHSTESLAIAAATAREEGFDRFRPVEGNVLELPFEDASFDVVVSWGVLHHTSDPLRGFREMVRVCRPGGHVGIFLYNKWGHWRHNLQKEKVSRLAGDDVEERFAVAHRLYGTKPVAEMTPDEIASFYDKYCHPHKSDHTLEETLSWFEQLGCEYTGSYPPLALRDALACLQYRATLDADFPIERPRNRTVVNVAARLPDAARSGPFPRPSALHTAAWQAVYAWMGRRGGYSHGSALAARKR